MVPSEGARGAAPEASSDGFKVFLALFFLAAFLFCLVQGCLHYHAYSPPGTKTTVWCEPPLPRIGSRYYGWGAWWRVDRLSDNGGTAPRFYEGRYVELVKE